MSDQSIMKDSIDIQIRTMRNQTEMVLEALQRLLTDIGSPNAMVEYCAIELSDFDTRLDIISTQTAALAAIPRSGDPEELPF